MFAGLRALLTGLIDYAGMFPPARLPLDEAIRNYAAYRRGADAWMLGRFVVPASRLTELDDAIAEHFADGPPLTVAALGRGGAAPEEFVAGLGADLRDIATFRSRHGDRVAVDAIEARPPLGIDLPEIIRQTQSAGLRLFVEGTDDLIGWLTRARLDGGIGFKLRCGGAEATAFPNSEQVAIALWVCLNAGLPFKATAGLHHPLPRFDASLGARMHGFVNVFLAGALARTHQLTVGQIPAILNDEDPDHFSFDDTGAGWRDLRATTAEIATARGESILSFGSCSFDEPRDDLRALGWLSAEGEAR